MQWNQQKYDEEEKEIFCFCFVFAAMRLRSVQKQQHKNMCVCMIGYRKRHNVIMAAHGVRNSKQQQQKR